MSALLGGADQHLVGLTQQDGLLAGAQFAGVLVAALEDKAGVRIADGLGGLVGALPDGVAAGNG